MSLSLLRGDPGSSPSAPHRAPWSPVADTEKAIDAPVRAADLGSSDVLPADVSSRDVARVDAATDVPAPARPLRVTGYYAGWMQDAIPPAALALSSVTHIMHFSLFRGPMGRSTPRIYGPRSPRCTPRIAGCSSPWAARAPARPSCRSERLPCAPPSPLLASRLPTQRSTASPLFRFCFGLCRRPATSA